MEEWGLLSDIVLLLGSCMLVGGIFARFGQSPLVGYLLAGMLLGGPGSFHLIHSEHAIEAIAELGVALLLFSLGLEFSWERLRALGSRTLIAGFSQVILTLVAAGAVAKLLGRPLAESTAIGAMVALSSTAVVLRVLLERSEVETPHGRITLAALLAQDVAVVPLTILMTLLGQGGGAADVLLNLGKILLSAVGLIVILYVVLNKLAVRALGTLTLERNRELTLILAIVVGLGSAWLANKGGISPSLGAFFAGMFLGSSPFAVQIRADVSSLRTVLLTLFFGSAGMVGDLIWIGGHLPLVLGVSLLVIVGKAVIVWGIARVLGRPHYVAIAAGICLAQIGEFAFVLGSLGLASGVISPEILRLMVSVVIVTLFVSPFLIPHAVALGKDICERIGAEPPAAGENEQQALPPPEILIIGFGPAGQLTAAAMYDRQDRVAIIDMNHKGILEARRNGYRAEVGDASRPEVLEHVHVSSAKAVIITIPDPAASMRILQEVRLQAPHAFTIVRSRYQRFAHEYADHGACVVVGDEEEVGARLCQELLEWLSAIDETGELAAGPV
jgi:CPA2 family monovalent cation:H+ antiporter-2